MRIELDPASPVPIYIQIVEQVRRLIALGALRKGDRLPTVRELAVQCRINRNTVGRAIQELERDGIVRTQVGQGTFVADVKPEIDPVERDSLLDLHIDRLLIEARSLGVPLEQLPSRLWRRIESFRESRASSGSLIESVEAGNRAATEDGSVEAGNRAATEDGSVAPGSRAASEGVRHRARARGAAHEEEGER